MLDCFEGLGVDVAVLTETWFGEETAAELSEDLSGGSGLSSLTLNRGPNERGVCYGGVAVVWREAFGAFKRVSLKNPDSFEVLPVAGSVKGHRRKFCVVACYLPPGYNRERGNKALNYIEDVVVQLKRKFQDPYIAIAGDFNQWRIQESTSNFADLSEVEVGPTRGSRAIDRIFLNMSRAVVESGTLAPLETEEEGRKSDHRIAYCRLNLKRREVFRWETYSYRKYCDTSVAKFREWVTFHGWSEVLEESTAEGKARAYQETLKKAVEACFQLRTVRRKSTDPPWLDRKTKKLIEDKNKLYVTEGGRTAVWKEEKKRTDAVVKERKRKFMDIQRETLLAEDAGRNFYRNVKSFSTAEKPKLFDVRDIMPEGLSDQEIAESLAEYFNRVSNEFEPLTPDQIPCTRDKELPILHEYEVAARVRKFKKPRSTVPGDIFPKLVTQFADFLAVPLTNIYNCITVTRQWPACWKIEYVTVIPKKSTPESLGDLRNISCTLLASKIYESYVLDWMKLEVALRSNQYGGVKGLSTDHLLVNLWQQVLENAEDYRSGTVIASIDYSKALTIIVLPERNVATSSRTGVEAPFRAKEARHSW